MADEIRPVLPTPPGPPVSPPPEEKRRQRRQPPEQDEESDDKQKHDLPSDGDKGGHIDEYV